MEIRKYRAEGIRGKKEMKTIRSCIWEKNIVVEVIPLRKGSDVCVGGVGITSRVT